MKPILKTILSTMPACVAVLLMGGGCASQQKTDYQPTPSPAPTATTAPAPAAQPRASTGTYGPHSMTFEKDGIKYVRGSLAYPSGLQDGGGLLLEKTVRSEVMAGTPFTYHYKVSNLTPCEVRDVVVYDTMSSNFRMTASDPKATEALADKATWRLGDIAPGAAKVIAVTGTVEDAGSMNTCGWVTYMPVLCEAMNVVKPAIQLTKQLPPEALICDPIPLTLVAKNAGTSPLTDVTVTDSLPAGLAAAGGATTLVCKIGNLAAGESRQIVTNLTASKTGNYDNTAKVTCAQGVQAQARAATVVRAPVLTLACNVPAERFAGRPVEMCLTVGNTGDAPAANTVVEALAPAGAVFKSATAGGRFENGRVVWNVGAVAPKGSSKLCATFVSEVPGTLAFSAKAAGVCAREVTTACQTRISGIPAILLEVIDIEDPIEVNNNETYEIVVTNQGSAPATNVKIVCTLEAAQQYISATGQTPATASGQTVSMAPVPSIAPKAKASWRVVVKAVKAGDTRFEVKMTSDQLTRPVEETESTNQY
ncbi:MAG: DUF11 domain-containing protein [Verrucomicrobia bacterium]|nr:DUF11 domain-containing protein [Verrucomicrobiota bacterium]